VITHVPHFATLLVESVEVGGHSIPLRNICDFFSVLHRVEIFCYIPL